MKYYDQVKEMIIRKDLTGAIAFAEDKLRQTAKSDFHWVLGKDFLHLTEPLYAFISSNASDINKINDTEAFYSELNGFSINYDKWFLDFAAYGMRKDYHDDDSDWLCDAFWGSINPEYFELTGLRPLMDTFRVHDQQSLYESLEINETAELTEYLVVFRLQQLFEEVISQGRKNGQKWASIPWGVTAHDYHLIYVIE